jgi:peptide deformylase
MALLTILTYPHPILRKQCTPVTVFDVQLEKLAHDMLETMYDDEAVGLAANQIGFTQRLLVLDATEDASHPYILVNPEIIAQKGKEKSKEGCMSVPDIYVEVERAAEVTVRAQDIKGNVFTIENATGLLSNCLQHEIDHLNGKLFIDYLSPLKKQMIEKKLKKMACRT